MLFKSLLKIFHHLRSPKERLNILSSKVVSIIRSCGAMYIVETDCSIKTRLHEYQRFLQHEHNKNHKIRF